MIRALLLASAAAGVLAGGRGPPAVGDAAPAIELETLEGGRASLGALRGHPVIINFWASWCRPCSDEMPELVRRYQELHPAGLEVLAINLTRDDRKKDIRRFAGRFRLPFPVLLDARGKVRRRYALVGVPTTVFVDTAGVVAEVCTGPLTPGVLEHGLRAILPR
jgi:peroxiredoxin